MVLPTQMCVVPNGRGTKVTDLSFTGLEGRDRQMEEEIVVDIVYEGEEKLSEATTQGIKNIAVAVNDDVKAALNDIKPENATRRGRTPHFVTIRRLRPLWELQPEPEELHEIWCQIISCHYELWKGGVHHRDISVWIASPTTGRVLEWFLSICRQDSNLMYYRAKGVLKGVLNDYGLVTLAGSGRKFGKERTGNIPFMACELLTKQGRKGEVEHQYRHDLESFIWVFAWVSCGYKDGKFCNEYLAEWAKLGASIQKKAWFLHRPSVGMPSDLEPSYRFRVLRYAFHISKQMGSHAYNEGRLDVLRMWTEDNQEAAANPELQIEIANLEYEPKRKPVDEVFREFAAVIEYTEVDTVIDRVAKSILR